MKVRSRIALQAIVLASFAVQLSWAQTPSHGFDAATFARTFTHHTVVLNGVRLHYVMGGKGDPVVLLHGWPVTWYEWRYVMPLLSARHTVIAPDLRGLGDSSRPAGGYDTRMVAEDIHQLVRSLGFSSVCLAGHDWGGAVAFAYAANHREGVRRLAILEMYIPGFGLEEAMQITPQRVLWHFAFHMAPDVPEMLVSGKERQYLSVFYSGLRSAGDDPNAITPEEIDEYVRVYTQPGALRASFSYYRAVFQDADQNREALKTKLPMPVLALGGERNMGESVAGRLREAATDLRIGVVPRAGHWVAHDQPEFVAEQLLAFFQQANTATEGREKNRR